MAVSGLVLIARTVSLAGQIFLGASNQLPGQSPQQKKVHLTGRVVNAVTGEGVPKAKVEIFAGEPFSVFSGADGHFEVENGP